MKRGCAAPDDGSSALSCLRTFDVSVPPGRPHGVQLLELDTAMCTLQGGHETSSRDIRSGTYLMPADYTCPLLDRSNRPSASSSRATAATQPENPCLSKASFSRPSAAVHVHSSPASSDGVAATTGSGRRASPSSGAGGRWMREERTGMRVRMATRIRSANSWVFKAGDWKENKHRQA